ncbi:MAG: GGDEF domain-containing protein, partial [Nitrospirae bacterium]|nr:GGDEF domain-containing protein [Nitrospirota bacterium]
TPCSFCKMPETAETGTPTTSEFPLPNDEYQLVHWAKVESAAGQVHVVETITDNTAMKRQQAETDVLVKKLSATNRDLLHANQLLLEQSLRDSLTGLYNHSHFQQTLVQLCAAASRSMRPLSLLFIDLDNFKQINDLYGHTVGDQVLREIGRLLDSPQDPGELTILPELVALRTPPFSLTCSVGVASFPIHASVPSDLVVAADAAVYVAKRAGKNCVRMASPAAPSSPLLSPLVRS